MAVKRERKFITLPPDVLERGRREADAKGMNFSAYVSMAITEYWRYQDRQDKVAQTLGESMAERKDMDNKALELLQRMMAEMERLEPKR